MVSPAIQLDDVSKRFHLQRERRTALKERLVRGRAPRAQEFWALRDVTLDVPAGSSLALIGHNGAGKSTALKVMAGIYRPTTGRVAVRGKLSALLELGAGFHPELSGRENIRMNASILGMSKRQIDAVLDDIIDYSGLEDFIDSPVKVYSSGMYVRLGFAVAVKVDPEILMVDEIISVGDEEFQRKCMDYLFELRQQGCTLVLVSHSMAAVETICQEAAWIDHGRLRALGPSRDVVHEYLSSVNAQQQAAEAGSGSEEGRMGSGELRIDRLEYLDATGVTTRGLITGQPGTVRIHYRASRQVADAVFGLGFVHESGVQVSGPNSRRTGPYVVVPGLGYVDFRMDSVLLTPGIYQVSTAVVSSGHFYDYLDRHFRLFVRGAAGLDEPGLSIHPGQWMLAGAEGRSE